MLVIWTDESSTRFLSRLFTCLLMLLISCHSGRQSGEISQIKFAVNYPVVLMYEDETKFFNMRDTLSIFYYRDYVLYRLAPTRRFETEEKLYGTEPYFLYQQKSKYGYYFRSLRDTSKGTKLAVDSFLKQRAFASTLEPKPEYLHTTIRDKKNKTILEKYIPKGEYDENSFDSVYFYYSDRLKHIQYSFSPNVESIKKMKVYKVRLLYNERFSASNKILLPKREYFFEIIDAPTFRENEIKEIFSRFIKAAL